MKKHSQEYVEEYYAKYGYEIISTYKNLNAPLKMKCPFGHITETMSFASFRKGCRCPICSRRAKLTYEFVKEQFEKEGYLLLSKIYKNANTKLKTICPKGHKWEVTYGHFYSGKRCGECDKTKKLTYEFVKSEFEKRGYKLLSEEYIKAQSPLIVECPNGHVTDTISWANFSKWQGCKICKESKGEKRISNFLIKNSINYIREKRFPDCRDRYTLPFDFYLPNYNICIEYDGGQHYKPVDFSGGDYDRGVVNLFETKKRDTIKNKFCRKNNIKLIRIPYWDFDNIEKILHKEIIK